MRRLADLVHTAVDVLGANTVAAGCLPIAPDFTPPAKGTRPGSISLVAGHMSVNIEWGCHGALTLVAVASGSDVRAPP